MSRTHKTKPLGVKVCQGYVGAKEEHDHSKGPCDLPKMNAENAAYGAPKTRCYWQPDFYNPLSFCGCTTCSGYHHNNLNNKRNRKQARRKTREFKKDLELYDEELIEDKREFW